MSEVLGIGAAPRRKEDLRFLTGRSKETIRVLPGFSSGYFRAIVRTIGRAYKGPCRRHGVGYRRAQCRSIGPAGFLVRLLPTATRAGYG